jgi:hypothetical protein
MARRNEYDNELNAVPDLEHLEYDPLSEDILDELCAYVDGECEDDTPEHDEEEAMVCSAQKCSISAQTCSISVQQIAAAAGPPPPPRPGILLMSLRFMLPPRVVIAAWTIRLRSKCAFLAPALL